MRLSDFKVLTFDCYGTLIDWESGILKALQPLADSIDPVPSPNAMLEAFAKYEAVQERRNPLLLYPEILSRVYASIANEWRVVVEPEECEEFGRSVGEWPAFPDSSDALAYLKGHFKLVILSNVDTGSFRATNALLGVEFDNIYTAQDIGTYKPDQRNFDFLLAALDIQGYAKSDILHVAQSLFHDHAPANRLGLATAWIDRRHEKEGSGATAQPESLPHFDFRFSSMAELADAHRKESRAA